MKTQETNPKLRVYYDGLCRLCSREINHYRKATGSENIEFIDICGAGFDASQEEVDPFMVHQIMHVRKLDGELATRVDAFIAIWETLPNYRVLAQAAKVKPIYKILDMGYSVFAKVRPLLPRKAKIDCEASPYCEVKNAR